MPDAPILIVAGGSRGIGAAAARLAGARGFDVAVNYLRDDKAAAAVVAAIRQSGRRAIAVKGDMGREEDIAGMLDGDTATARQIVEKARAFHATAPVGQETASAS